MKNNNTLRINHFDRIAIKADGTRIPVVDGKFDFVIQPTKEDIDKAIIGDHAQCMYCVACRRMYFSDLVWVTRGVAYVELQTKGGKPVLQRFILTDPAKRNVKDFDAGEDLSPEAVIFAAPKGYRRLDAIALKNRKNAGRQKKKAYLVGEKAGSKKSHDRVLPPLEVGAVGLRARGTGMFQFKLQKEPFIKKGSAELDLK